jgi:hypothetical protein
MTELEKRLRAIVEATALPEVHAMRLAEAAARIGADIEREECAKLVSGDAAEGSSGWGRRFADAIRARKGGK